MRTYAVLSLASLALAVPQSFVTTEVTTTYVETYMESGHTVTTTATDTGMVVEASGSAQDQVQEVLSNLYGTNIPPKATGAVATTLADDIDRYDSSLVQEPIWSSAAGAIVSAALTAFGPSGYYGALTAGGFAQPDFTSADWYKTGVPKSFQAVWASVDSEIHDIQTSVLDAAAQPTSTGSSAATTTTDSGSVASTSTNTGAAAPARATAQALGGLAAGIAMAAVAGL